MHVPGRCRLEHVRLVLRVLVHMHVPGRCRLEHVRLVLRVLLVHMHVPGRCRLEHVRLVLRVLLKVGSGFTCTYLGAAASNTCDWCWAAGGGAGGLICCGGTACCATLERPVLCGGLSLTSIPSCLICQPQRPRPTSQRRWGACASEVMSVRARHRPSEDFTP
jgi:hypothetical protein